MCSELYQKAINDGPTITLHIAKAMTIGPPRVGKTYLRHHLLGLQPPECSPSTPVMKTAETISLSFVQSSTDDQGWIPMSGISGIESLLEYLRKDNIKSASLEQAEALTLPTVVLPDKDVNLKGNVIAVHGHPVDNASPVAKNTASNAPSASQEHNRPSTSKMIDHVSDNIPLFIREMHELLQSAEHGNKISLPDAHLLQFIDCGDS